MVRRIASDASTPTLEATTITDSRARSRSLRCASTTRLNDRGRSAQALEFLIIEFGKEFTETSHSTLTPAHQQLSALPRRFHDDRTGIVFTGPPTGESVIDQSVDQGTHRGRLNPLGGRQLPDTGRAAKDEDGQRRRPRGREPHAAVHRCHAAHQMHAGRVETVCYPLTLR